MSTSAFSLTIIPPVLLSGATRGVDRFAMPLCYTIAMADVYSDRLADTMERGGWHRDGPGPAAGIIYAGEPLGDTFDPELNLPPYSAYSAHTPGWLMSNGVVQVWVRATQLTSNFLGIWWTPKVRFFGRAVPGTSWLGTAWTGSVGNSYIDSKDLYPSSYENIGDYFVSCTNLDVKIGTIKGGSGAECIFGTPILGVTYGGYMVDSCLIYCASNGIPSTQNPSGTWTGNPSGSTIGFADQGPVAWCQSALLGEDVSGSIGMEFDGHGVTVISDVRTPDGNPLLLAPMPQIYSTSENPPGPGRRGYWLDLIWRSSSGSFGALDRIMDYDCMCLSSDSGVGEDGLPTMRWSMWAIMS